LIRAILNLYILVIIIDTILSYLPQYKNHPFALNIQKAANFSLKPVKKILPPDMPFDISPIIVILLIKLIEALW